MLLGFKQRFVEPILTGSKIHTLRLRRKKPPKLGETLYMYTGLRTNNSELICKNHTLLGEQKTWVRIDFVMSDKKAIIEYRLKVCVDGFRLSDQQLYDFVINDGFTGIADFVEYWISPAIRKQVKKLNLTYKWLKIATPLRLHHWTTFKYKKQ